MNKLFKRSRRKKFKGNSLEVCKKVLFDNGYEPLDKKSIHYMNPIRDNIIGHICKGFSQHYCCMISLYDDKTKRFKCKYCRIILRKNLSSFVVMYAKLNNKEIKLYKNKEEDA